MVPTKVVTCIQSSAPFCIFPLSHKMPPDPITMATQFCETPREYMIVCTMVPAHASVCIAQGQQSILLKILKRVRFKTQREYVIACTRLCNCVTPNILSSPKVNLSVMNRFLRTSKTDQLFVDRANELRQAKLSLYEFVPYFRSAKEKNCA